MRLGLLLSLIAATAGSGDDAPAPASVQLVTPAEIRAAMAPEREAGYDLTATTNQARFHAAVLLALARAARERDPDGAPLLIPPDPWYDAYLALAGRSPADAPLFAELSRRYRQWRLVEYRTPRVIERVVEGPQPELALGVRLFWSESGQLDSKFSFRDERSVPRLAVTNHRDISYRMLVYPDMIVFDSIQGLTGRPTSGGLALLFKLIGEGSVAWSRQMLAPDGLQLTRTEARKGVFTRTAVITVRPDGTAFRGLEPDRPELKAYEARLLEPIQMLYYAVPGAPSAERLAAYESAASGRAYDGGR